MGPRASRNCVTSVPLGHRRWTSRRVSSGMGSKPWDFSDIGHLVSCSNRGGHLPPTGYALSLSLPHLTCSLVWTEFPNRVINRHLRMVGVICQCASSGPTDGRIILSMCTINRPPTGLCRRQQRVHVHRLFCRSLNRTQSLVDA